MGSARPVVEGSHWAVEPREAILWGPLGILDPTDISGLTSNPDPDIVGPTDTAGLGAGMPLRGPGGRLDLLGATAFDPHSREEADSACLQGSLVGDQLSLSGIRPPFCKWVGNGAASDVWGEANNVARVVLQK